MLRRCVIVGAMGALVASTGASATDRFVDISQSASGTGQSWATAYRFLHEAIAVAELGDTIYIAEGTYFPHHLVNGQPGTDRNLTFTWNNGVAIRGGYPAGGADDPDPVNHPTILSANIGQAGLVTDNSYRIMELVPGTEDVMSKLENSILSGLVFQDGYGDPNGLVQPVFEWDHDSVFGAADVYPLVSDCVIRDNLTTLGAGSYVGGQIMLRGAGGSSDAEAFEFRDCTFADNVNDGGRGGAVSVIAHGDHDTRVAFVRSRFEGNEATGSSGGEGLGGALELQAENSSWDGLVSIHAVSCVFAENHADSGGGAIGNSKYHSGAQMQLHLHGCLFHGNTVDGAVSGGGAVLLNGPALDLVNCTIADNVALAGGGGIQIDQTSSSSGPVIIRNAIVWGNETNGSPSQIVLGGAASATIESSDVQGGWTGTGNINADPGFADAGAGDYTLGMQSPCIHTGDFEVVPADAFDLDEDGNATEPLPLDLATNPRTVCDLVDMGAYERCWMDLDCDLEYGVGMGDMLVVLSSWGPCPGGGAPCPADLNGNGEVDFNDLLVILSNWSCGAATYEAAPQSVLDCMEKYASNPLAMAKCIEAMWLAGTP